jgi:hypothetical protein
MRQPSIAMPSLTAAVSRLISRILHLSETSSKNYESPTNIDLPATLLGKRQKGEQSGTKVWIGTNARQIICIGLRSTTVGFSQFMMLKPTFGSAPTAACRCHPFPANQQQKRDLQERKGS